MSGSKATSRKLAAETSAAVELALSTFKLHLKEDFDPDLSSDLKGKETTSSVINRKLAADASTPPSSKLHLEEDFDPDLSRKMKVTETPSAGITLPDVAYCSATDLHNFAVPGTEVFMALIADRVVLTLSPHRSIRSEHIALNAVQRRDIQVSTGDEIRIKRFVPPEDLDLTAGLEFVKKGVNRSLNQPLHGVGTTVSGMVLAELNTVLIAADSKRTNLITVEETEVKLPYYLQQKIYEIRDWIVVGFSGDCDCFETLAKMLVSCKHLHAYESLDITIKKIWKQFKGSIKQYKNNNPELKDDVSLISALVGMISGGQAQLWRLEDYICGPTEVKTWTSIGSGGKAAEMEFGAAGESWAGSIDDATELCIRSVYSASFKDEFTGGAVTVIRLKQGNSMRKPRIERIFAARKEMKRYFFFNRSLRAALPRKDLLPRLQEDNGDRGKKFISRLFTLAAMKKNTVEVNKGMKKNKIEVLGKEYDLAEFMSGGFKRLKLGTRRKRLEEAAREREKEKKRKRNQKNRRRKRRKLANKGRNESTESGD